MKKKKKVIDVMKNSGSAGGVYEGWTEYYMKWNTVQQEDPNRLLIALITVPYNRV